MLLLKKKISLTLNLLFCTIFIIKLMNALLTNIDKIFLIINIDHIFFRIFLIINLVLNLSLLLILIQSLSG